MKKISSENLYLIISVVSALLLPFSLYQVEDDFLSIWTPFWILVLLLPFYGIIQITKQTDDWNIKYWIALLINIVSFIFILNFLNLNILPD